MIDAQLPKRLSRILNETGYDSIHTQDLHHKNHTKDRDINLISVSEQRVVVSKDADFIDSVLISDKPYKLLYVATGNISNNDLLKIFTSNIRSIDEMFEDYQLSALWA
ncbi:MAG: DUF5615 family PIN-like protein [Desulfamplus sp.]|nr:DUF5615 family PIN-like protein [Desulfamplus sp.]